MMKITTAHNAVLAVLGVSVSVSACSVLQETRLDSLARYQRYPTPIDVQVSPGVLIPAAGAQSSPDVDGHRLVWSEQVGTVRQIIHLNLTTLERHQVAACADDCVTPQVRGDWLLWMEDREDGSSSYLVRNLADGREIGLDAYGVGWPRLYDGGVIWSAFADLENQVFAVQSLDLNTLSVSTLAEGRGFLYPTRDGDYSAWETSISPGQDGLYRPSVFIRRLADGAVVLDDAPSVDQHYPYVRKGIVAWTEDCEHVPRVCLVSVLDIASGVRITTGPYAHENAQFDTNGRVVVWAGPVSIMALDLASGQLYALRDPGFSGESPAISDTMIFWSRIPTETNVSPSGKLAVMSISDVLGAP